jgi:transcription initiation factor TFIIB
MSINVPNFQLTLTEKHDYSSCSPEQISIWRDQLLNPSTETNQNETKGEIKQDLFTDHKGDFSSLPLGTDYKASECPKCYQEGLYLFEGVLICRSCSSEFGGAIDDSPEWKLYGQDDNRGSDPTRCGHAIHPLLIESSYGTTFGYTRSAHTNRLKQLNNWQAMPYHERSLKIVFDRLTQNCVSHGLTQTIIDFSHRLFAEIVQNQTTLPDAKLSRGDPREGIIAACLFYACQEYEASRSPQEIAVICEVDDETVTRGINLAFESLKNSQLVDVTRYVTKYTDFIDRYCNRLGINQKLTNEIRQFAHKVNDMKLLTKNTPQAMVSGCIYFIVSMHRLKITKTDISQACGPSVPTITKAYEKLLPYICELV